LGKTDLFYWQLKVEKDNKTKLKPVSPCLPRLNFMPSFPTLLPLDPKAVHGGWGMGDMVSL